MKSTLSVFVVLLSLLLTLSQCNGNPHPFFAARCLAKGKRCGQHDSRMSGSCRSFKVYWEQPKSCSRFACNWCNQFKERSKKAPCNDWRVKTACMNLNKSPSNSPARSTPPSPKPQNPNQNPNPNRGICPFDRVWVGSGDNVVIDLGRVPLVKGWEYVSRNNLNGIVFLHSPARGISPPGRYGRMCFNVRAPQSGKYYFTAISYAPHPTEHNDVWVGSSKGFQLWQNGRMRTYAKPGTWTKAYQNNGKKGMSEHFKTIDFNGHRFLVPGVQAGEKFEICIAGRSKRYEMYRLILKKCVGDYCRGKIKSGKELFDMKPSRCV